MSWLIHYLLEAIDDIESAHSWYERQSPDLGNQFLDALRDTIQPIEANPFLFAMQYRDFRAVSVGKFPYVIYFRIRDDDVLVFAVQHNRRNSRAWRKRGDTP